MFTLGEIYDHGVCVQEFFDGNSLKQRLKVKINVNLSLRKHSHSKVVLIILNIMLNFWLKNITSLYTKKYNINREMNINSIGCI